MELKAKVPALTLKLGRKKSLTAGLERLTLETVTDKLIIHLDKHLR